MKKVHARFSITSKLLAVLMVLMALVCSMGAVARTETTPIVSGKALGADFENAVDFVFAGNAKAKGYNIKKVALKLKKSAVGAFLKVGEATRLKVVVTYGGKLPKDYIESLVFSVSDPDVVDLYYDGSFKKKSKRGFYVKPLKTGNAKIEVVAEGKSYSIMVCAIDRFEAGVTISKREMSLAKGEEAALMATMYKPKAQSDFTWQSSNSSVATVTKKGGVVKALTDGVATITATKKKQSAQCVVTVGTGATSTPTPSPSPTPPHGSSSPTPSPSPTPTPSPSPTPPHGSSSPTPSPSPTPTPSPSPTPTPTPSPTPTPTPTPPSGPQPIPYIDDYTYEKQGSGIVITDFNTNSAARDLVIPSEIEGLAVVAIGSNAFRSCSNLTSITIPSGVTSIGTYAFCDCASLRSITIPSSATSIGSNAFRSCSSLTSITIPYGVTSIGDYTFLHCASLTSITIPSSVTSIENSAFRSCTSLRTMTIPSSVTSIGNYGFLDCDNLTSVSIPSSVTSIGNRAFGNCPKLTVSCPAGSYAEQYCASNSIPCATT